MENNGWNEYRLLVIDRLDKVEQSQREILLALGKINGTIAQLQVKSGLWGVLGGVATVLGILLVSIL